MGRRLILAVVLIVVALVAYNYVTTGRLALVPTATLSEEEKELNAVDGRVRQAIKEYLQAGRAAGLSGIDTTSQVEAAKVEVARAQKELEKIRAKASAQLKGKMDQLQRKIDEARRELGMR